MLKLFTTLSFIAFSTTAIAQTQIPNGGFENWGNTAPGNADEPTGFYSNKTGSSTAQLGPQTCFKDNTIVHSGAASVRVESKIVPVILVVVNGVMTTGVVNAPSTNKADGYIGTQKYNDTTDVRRMSFTGRPDSLVGWYQYTQGGAAEQGKIRATLHVGQFFDPETTSTFHPDATANKIGTATFLTPVADVAVWTRFSVAFTYVASTTPAYIMINATSSNDQMTLVAGSKLWLDDLAVIYNSSSNVGNIPSLDHNVTVYYNNQTLHTDFLVRNNGRYTLQVFDIMGRKVALQEVTGNGLNKLDLSSLTTGIYSYKLVGANAQTAGRFAVQ